MSNPHPVTSWKKGKSGNPSGVKKRPWTVKSLIEAVLEEKHDLTKQPMRMMLVRKLVDMAIKGDIIAIKEINNRLDGMPSAALDVTSNGEPIEVNIDAIIGLSQTPAKATISGTTTLLPRM
jgi:hypothetical protein